MVNDFASMLIEPDYPGFPIGERKMAAENKAFGEAIRQVPEDEWIIIRRKWEQVPYWQPGYKEHHLRVDCREVLTERVYVPVFEEAKIPADTFLCNYCGGYTKNDDRGNCSACGAGRQELIAPKIGFRE